MKVAKILLGFMMVMLMATMAFAQGNGNGNAGATGTAAGDQVMLQVQEQSQVKGLENAMLRVRNEEQVQHLEKVLAMIQEKRQERLNQLDDLEIVQEEEGEEITAEGVGDAEFLGLIKVQKRFRYVISEEGAVQYQRQWYDNLFVFEE